MNNKTGKTKTRLISEKGDKEDVKLVKVKIKQEMTH